MVSPDKPNVPRVVQGVDLRSLPIGPLEGFVLTRMDGALPIPALADMTGQPEDEVRSAVERLVSLGAAEWVDAPAPEPEPEPETETETETDSFAVADTEPPPSPDRDVPYDPAELEEEVDLPLERRKQVLGTYYRLDELDYYALLGVDRDADKKAIRAAYFALSKIFHPDTFFGRNLGSFKTKMEKVFRQLTEAYDTLGRKKSRQAYDEYLGLKDTTHAAQQAMEETNRQAEAIEQETGAPTREPAPAAPRHSSEAVRRELFARRLTAAAHRSRSSAPAPTASVPPSSSAPPSPSEPAASVPPPITPPAGDRREVLRGLAQSLKEAGRFTGGGSQVQRSLAEARRAEAEGDLVEAANALRLALALVPDDPDVQREYDRVHDRLARGLADTYEKQARYEEETEKWASAALSWSRVVQGRPRAPEPARRAARALVEAGGDLRQARDFAQKAVDLQPDDARNRAVLGQVYKAAGMALNARRELRQAAELDPNDEMVKNLLRELDS